MAVFVISDLHLSHGADKPMDIFGNAWLNHTERIRENWCNTVNDSDYVVIPGDISWGMRTADALEDLKFIDGLPGKKIIGKGNHDYWWSTASKLNALCEKEKIETVKFLYNNAYLCENIIVCGTKGWLPESQTSEADLKFTNRAGARLRLALDEGVKLLKKAPDAELAVFLHYPPIYGASVCYPVTDLLEEYSVKRCFYGHIHSASSRMMINKSKDTELILTSADHLGFSPLKIN